MWCMAWGSDVPSVGEAARTRARLPPELLLTKLHPPPIRTQTLARGRLLERLRLERGVKLAVIAAPAGCGKTTLLSTWCDDETTRRPVAWVTLDEGDRDPVVLWAH